MHYIFTPGTLLLIFLYYFILQSETLHNCGPCWQSAWQRKDSNKTDPGTGPQMHSTFLETSVHINFRCTNRAFRRKGARSWIHILPCWAYIPYSNAICMTWYVDKARSPLEVVIIKMQAVYQEKWSPRNQYLKNPCG